MKRTSRLLYLQLAAVVAMFSFGLRAYAETPRDELVHAYWLVKTANKDYGGHRATALHAIENAGHNLGLELKGGLPEKERQWKSDAQLEEAVRLLRDSRDKLEASDRQKTADHVEHAIQELDKALKSR
jgi:hypothetical protein